MIRQKIDIERDGDAAVVPRVMRVGNRFYVEVHHPVGTRHGTLMLAINNAIDAFLNKTRRSDDHHGNG